MVDLSYFGFGEGNPDALGRGKRRTVTYTAFIIFSMLVASVSNIDWVKGGLEFSIGATEVQGMTPTQLADAIEESGLTSSSCGLPMSASQESAPELSRMLGAGVSQLFHFSLVKATVSRASTFTYSGQNLLSDCQYDLAPYVVEINAAAQNCSGGGGSFSNPWCDDKPVNINVFNSALGLLGFSAFLQASAWVTLSSQSLEVPYLGNHKYVFETTFGCQLGAAFFSMIAWVQFLASGLKTEFCISLDPDEQYIGLPCNYGDGFNTAVASSVLAILNALAMFYWMPRTVGARYEFSAPLGKSGYDPVGPAGGESTGLASGGVSSSGYQDFGSAATSL